MKNNTTSLWQDIEYKLVPITRGYEALERLIPHRVDPKERKIVKGDEARILGPYLSQSSNVIAALFEGDVPASNLVGKFHRDNEDTRHERDKTKATLKLVGGSMFKSPRHRFHALHALASMPNPELILERATHHREDMLKIRGENGRLDYLMQLAIEKGAKIQGMHGEPPLSPGSAVARLGKRDGTFLGHASRRGGAGPSLVPSGSET